jgi:hypothetical protein
MRALNPRPSWPLDAEPDPQRTRYRGRVRCRSAFPRKGRGLIWAYLGTHRGGPSGPDPAPARGQVAARRRRGVRRVAHAREADGGGPHGGAGEPSGRAAAHRQGAGAGAAPGSPPTDASGEGSEARAAARAAAGPRAHARAHRATVDPREVATSSPDRPHTKSSSLVSGDSANAATASVRGMGNNPQALTTRSGASASASTATSVSPSSRIAVQLSPRSRLSQSCPLARPAKRRPSVARSA